MKCLLKVKNNFNSALCNRAKLPVSKNCIITVALFILLVSSGLFQTFSYGETLSKDEQLEIKSQIDSILKSEEFSISTEKGGLLNSVSNMIKDMAEKLRELYKKLMKKIKLPDSKVLDFNKIISPKMTNFLKVFGIAVIFLLLLLIIYMVFQNLRLPKNIKKFEDAELLSVLRAPLEVEILAMKFYADGDCNQALRFLFIALLIKFNELNLIKIDKSKTNRQYLRELSGNSYAFIEMIQGFAEAFNEHWYGNKPLNRDTFDQWYDRYTFLTKEVKV